MLVDMLAGVSAMVLVVLVAIPGLARARESAKRAGCGMNLSNAGKAIAIYKASYEDLFPALSDKILTPGAVVGTNFDANNPKELSSTATQFMLMRDGSQSAKMYICPSTRDTEDTFVQRRGGDYHWDFSQRADKNSTEIDVDADQTSYGYAAPVTDGGKTPKITNTAGVDDGDRAGPVPTLDKGPLWGSNVALMADKGPAWGANPSANIPTLSATSAAFDLRRANSPNHRGQYINYLRADLAVMGVTSPIINDKDNLYTAFGGVVYRRFLGDNDTSDDAYSGTCDTDSWSAHTSETDSWVIGPKRK